MATREGREFAGTWDEIVQRMRDESGSGGRTLDEYMQHEARRGYTLTGVKIPTSDAESFIRGSADAGLLRIMN